MPSKDPIQRFEDILENITRIEGGRIWFMVERDLAPIKMAVQRALRQLRQVEGQVS